MEVQSIEQQDHENKIRTRLKAVQEINEIYEWATIRMSPEMWSTRSPSFTIGSNKLNLTLAKDRLPT